MSFSCVDDFGIRLSAGRFTAKVTDLHAALEFLAQFVIRREQLARAYFSRTQPLARGKLLVIAELGGHGDDAVDEVGLDDLAADVPLAAGVRGLCRGDSTGRCLLRWLSPSRSLFAVHPLHDMLALIERMGSTRFGVVGRDVRLTSCDRQQRQDDQNPRRVQSSPGKLRSNDGMAIHHGCCKHLQGS